MIRWLLLILVTIGCVVTFKLANQQMDRSVLITSHWEVQQDNIKNYEMLIWDVSDNKVFAYVGQSGFTALFKELWPFWTFFSVVILLLIPVAIYIIKIATNSQINRAIEKQKSAESEAEKKVKNIWEETKSYEQQVKNWAENKVSVANERAANAYNAAKKDALKELDDEKERIKTQHEFLHEFKKSLDSKESELNARIRRTNTWVMKEKQSFAEEQASLNSQKKSMIEENQRLKKARDNAKAAMLRYKKKCEQLKNELEC